ncbi:MAG: regulatory protein GemA [Ottowia sp.]|uniref:gp16 family protein n=1 Tax=Ottowia sp. TaxID=1898956 RepID=UPI003C774A4D
MSTTSFPRAGERQRLIRLVHTAKRDLQLDTETYRVALRTATGKDSCSAMSAAELQRTLDHLKRCGFKVRLNPKPSRPLDLQAENRKIRALWILLRDLGAIKNPSEEALAAYIKRMTGVDALQWINGQQAERVIEGLKKWALRFLPARVSAMVDALGPRISSLDSANQAALRATLSQAFVRQTFDPMLKAWTLLNQVSAAGE